MSAPSGFRMGRSADSWGSVLGMAVKAILR